MMTRTQELIYARLKTLQDIPFVPYETLHTFDAGGALKVHICNLRKKLPAGERIETVWGRGYRLVSE